MKIKRAVKLDLGEMCKLRLLFFVSREYLIVYLTTIRSRPQQPQKRPLQEECQITFL
jgi:hypothetical protein